MIHKLISIPSDEEYLGGNRRSHMSYINPFMWYLKVGEYYYIEKINANKYNILQVDQRYIILTYEKRLSHHLKSIRDLNLQELELELNK